MEADKDPTHLDPTGALIYYLCIKHAVEGGDYLLPSSHRIATQLRVVKSNRGVMTVRDDLWFVKTRKLLFEERLRPKSEFFRELAQHNVNKRINSFRPGFEKATPKRRRIVSAELVDKTSTAVRLVALKDLYYLTRRRLPKMSLLECLQSTPITSKSQEKLIDGADDFYTFLSIMNRIMYVELDPTLVLPEIDRQKFFLVEPGRAFRNQDMYIELRALDYYSERGLNRRAERLALRGRLETFFLNGSSTRSLSGSV